MRGRIPCSTTRVSCYPSRMVTSPSLALALAGLLALTAGVARADSSVECRRIAARIAKRRRFLTLRQAERLRFPGDLTFSPYCMEHPKDEDCQLPTRFPAERDISRNVADYSVGPHGEPPEMDPVIVPLLRRQRELHCKASG